jgi:cardiolipin synthase
MKLRTLAKRRSLRAFFRSFLRYFFGSRSSQKLVTLQWYFNLQTELLLRSPIAAKTAQSIWTARVWVDSEVFPRILKLIDRAEHTILIQMFIWKDDAIGRLVADALGEAADRGVKVQIAKEVIGDALELDKDFYSTKHSKDEAWQRFWNHPNIVIRHVRHDDHAKVYIFDGEVLLLTGMNIADEYHTSWHDYMVEVRGREFVEQYLTHGSSRDPQAPVQLFLNTADQREIRPTITKLLTEAQESIVVEHCYLSDPQIVDLLIQKSKDDVSVTVIVPEKPNHSQNSNLLSVLKLTTEGHPQNMEVFFYPGMFHAKILLIDRETAFLGSANLIPTSLDTVGEVNVLLQGTLQRAVVKLRDTLRGDILKSRPLMSPPYFSWLNRVMAWLRL